MSVNKVEIYNKKYVLANKIIKEIKLLPKTLRERKIEKESISRKLKLLKAKSNLLYKELDKITNNIMSIEKELSLDMINNDKIKSLQKLILNSINLGDSFNYHDFLHKDKKLRETIFSFLNFEGNFIDELSFIFKDNRDLTNLLIGAYSYLKVIQNDYPEKYVQIKTEIKSELNEIKNIYKKNPFDLILNYIDNTFKILENKEKVILFENEKEILNNKKNEIFLQIKLIEKQKSDIENTIVSVDSYINNIINIIDKHKLLTKYAKNEFNINKNNETSMNNNYQIKNKILNEEINENNSNIIYSKAKINDLNLTEKKNNRFNLEKKFVNIDFKDKDNAKEKKYNSSIDNFIKSNKKNEKMESINNSMKHNSIVKKINYINYKNIEELQRDIYDNYMELKNNPLYNIKNINIQVNKNIILKQRNSISKRKNNNNNHMNNDFKNKKSNKNIYITKGISPSNTMITYGNIILNKSNDINISDISFNNTSNNYKNLKSNRLTPKYNLRKSKESPNNNSKKSPKCKINKSIRLRNEHFASSQNSQILGETKLKINKSNNKPKIINKSPQKSPKTKSPGNSNNRKILANISSTNFKNSVPLVITNIDNLNFCTEQKTERSNNNQLTYSKTKKKNFYIDIKHNKTNLFNKLNEMESNNNKNNSNNNSNNIVKQNQKSYNKIKINLSDKELKKFKKGGENKSPDKSSLANLLYNSENKNLYNIKQKGKEISKININIEDEKENQEIKNNNNYYNNNKYIEINIKDSKNKNINNSSNNINIEYRIIPFKKFKTDRCNLNNILENKKNKNFQNNHKLEEKININDFGNNKLHFINSITSKKMNNYSFYNNDNRKQKNNIRKNQINK